MLCASTTFGVKLTTNAKRVNRSTFFRQQRSTAIDPNSLPARQSSVRLSQGSRHVSERLGHWPCVPFCRERARQGCLKRRARALSKADDERVAGRSASWLLATSSDGLPGRPESKPSAPWETSPLTLMQAASYVRVARRGRANHRPSAEPVAEPIEIQVDDRRRIQC
jgi:hypothetical protein